MKRFMGVILLAAMAGLAAPVPAPLSAQSARARSLASLFDLSSGIVRDTNGDGLADEVAARVIIPAAPAVEDVQAATSVAGRLGFETTAATFPLMARDTEDPPRESVPILIGTSNRFVQQLAGAGVLDLKSLAAGQGVIALVPLPDGRDAVVIAGQSNEGTLAAANLFAARLPRLWSPTGITIKALEEQAAGYARAAGAAVAGASLHSIIVEPERRGIGSVHVALALGGDRARAARAFEELDARHRRGLDTSALNFANVAATVLELGGTTVQVRRSGLNARTLTPPIDPDELAPDSPGERGARSEEARPAGPAKNYDLAGVYTIEGWLGDSYADLIPDRTETLLVVADAAQGAGAAHVAARLGLESTGITLPITREPKSIKEPAREANLVLFGRENALVKELEKIGKASFDDLREGEGVVQVVPRAFGNTPATVVAGADAAGAERASLHLGRRVPYVWETARGSLTLGDVDTEATRFFAAKTAGAQAAAALGAIDEAFRELKPEEIETIDGKVFIEADEPGLDKLLAARLAAKAPAAKVTVTTQAVTAAVPVFEDKPQIPWEVDEFWKHLREKVVPAVSAGSNVTLEARLSEPPEVRRDIAARARAELVKAGAASADVKIRSAYKQGFFWLTEEVIPQLKSRAVRSVRIRALAYSPDLTKKYKFYQVPSRWLHELYPVDEVMQKELGIPADAVSLELVDRAKEIYSVEALDGAGAVVYRGTFSPRFAEREYLDTFPGWSRVDVTTGWLSAAVNGKSIVDDRIQTDPERFWDHYQAKVLPRIYDHVMKVTEGKPLPDKQPFHRDLDVEIWMSEPDFRIGIDEELVSSLEALHEDLYFVTLDFYDALGRTTVKRRLAAPGKIYPIVHPPRAGQAGEARITFAGNASPKARLELSYRTKGADKPAKFSRDLTGIESPDVAVLREVIASDRVRSIGLQIDVKDDREATRAADLLDGLAALHQAGLFKTTFSYDHVGGLTVAIVTKEARATRVIANTGASEPSLVHRSTARPSGRVVTWDHVISPDESEQLVAKLAAFPEVDAYVAGRSYRGRGISAMEVTLPARGELTSPLKLSALKPTILITGRQHANEVSSTSHILRLAELLATDPEYRSILKRVNVILHPVENPDGAQMSYELQKLTPTHMLHAGRYSALGMDVASQVNEPEPLLPEARVRGRLWRAWLPDIYLNPHGYPSHEWVQQFAGYVPPGFRSYWSSRGWYTSVSGLRDPRYPEHARAVAAIRELIVREINGSPDVRAMNLRHQARYRKWAYGFGPHTFGQEIYKETAIYYSDPETGEPTGSRRAGASRGGRAGRPGMNAWPQVTYFTGGTEAPDETAQGDWLALVTRAGFSYLMAAVGYLRDGRYTIERIGEEGQRDSVSLTLLRVRPVLPGPAAPPTTTY
ncbi:MAG TPA: M14 family metallopeptidase [Vicinamibacterales bacterium]|nr:M14 family metallopeptidase [Vicinamibacterales bacterium]